MIRRGWSLALVLAGVVTASGGCLSSPSDVRVPVGREFTLAVGESVAVGDAGLRVSLRGVRDDSRCPADVTCIWEGDAAVDVGVAGPAPSPAAYELHTSARFTRETSHAGYRIALVRLDPTPHSGSAPSPSVYRATLVVLR